MPDVASWIAQLRTMMNRQHDAADASETWSLGVQDLLDEVPDYEICEALNFVRGTTSDPLIALLSAECERRNLDF